MLNRNALRNQIRAEVGLGSDKIQQNMQGLQQLQWLSLCELSRKPLALKK